MHSPRPASARLTTWRIHTSFALPRHRIHDTRTRVEVIDILSAADVVLIQLLGFIALIGGVELQRGPVDVVPHNGTRPFRFVLRRLSGLPFGGSTPRCEKRDLFVTDQCRERDVTDRVYVRAPSASENEASP